MSNEDPNLLFGTLPGFVFESRNQTERMKGNKKMIQCFTAALMPHEC